MSNHKFKIGDKVRGVYKTGNAGHQFTEINPLIGVVESIGTHVNSSPRCPYKVSGWFGCLSADELELVERSIQFLTDPEYEEIRRDIATIVDELVPVGFLNQEGLQVLDKLTAYVDQQVARYY